MDFELRAETPNDTAFLFELYAQTHGAHLATFPEPLVRMQFEAQRAHYRASFPGADHQIITLDGQSAGKLCADRTPERTWLIDIALLPAIQGRGLGTAVITSLLNASHHVTLSVQHGNPARRLYERLGFEVSQDQGLYLKMEWRAAR